MLHHYLKIAFRNLLRYKTQSMISIICLAVGFTCFALSALWIHYEMTYDNFHEGAERIYFVRTESAINESGLSPITPYPLAAYLKENFPEVETSSNNIYGRGVDYTIEGVTRRPLRVMNVDSAFVQMFQIKIVAGNKDFMIENSNKIAVTETTANKLFGTEDPIGKTIEGFGQKLTVCAVVKGWPEHSNMPFDVLEANAPDSQWAASSRYTFMKLKEGVNASEFAKKLYVHEIKKEPAYHTGFVLTPITKMRYDKPFAAGSIEVKFNHILLFVLAGILVIFCSLFNYLTIFVSRIRMRTKEMTLRKVCGSSNKGLFALCSVEFILNLFLTMLIGMALVEIVLPSFRELSGVYADKNEIYMEIIGYILAVIITAFLLAQLPVYYFRKRTLQASMSVVASGFKKNLFRKTSLVFQLFISLGFIFCAVVMMKQLHYLSHTDIGMERKGIASFRAYPSIDAEVSGNMIAQLPMVTEVLKGHYPLIPRYGSAHWGVEDWEDKPAGAGAISMEVFTEGEVYCRFYGMTLVEGVMPGENDGNDKIVINEKAVQVLGWADPVGKKLRNGKIVVGVIKDFYYQSPTTPVKPIAFTNKNEFNFGTGNEILFKYREDTWDKCKAAIEQWMHQEYPNAILALCDTEEEYDKYLKSENALLKLLGFVSGVCILIAVFGIFSLVTLTCEQRQKEIAIRKVNGAKASDILQMFFREYFVLLGVAAIIAFPVGYILMKLWMESYVKQVEISLWVYVSILASVAFIIAISIGGRVWNAARQNPSETIRNE